MDEVGKCKPLTAEPAPLVERLALLDERGKGNCAPLFEEDVLEAPLEEDEWWDGGATWWWCG